MNKEALTQIVKKYEHTLDTQLLLIKDLANELMVIHKGYVYTPIIHSMNINYYLMLIRNKALLKENLLLKYSKIPENGEDKGADIVTRQLLTKENIEEVLKENKETKWFLLLQIKRTLMTDKLDAEIVGEIINTLEHLLAKIDKLSERLKEHDQFISLNKKEIDKLRSDLNSLESGHGW